MRRLLLAAAAGLTTASTPATAQEHVHLTLNWLEVVSGTNTPVASPNGMLEPGESARISISVLITPPIGSPATYPPPPPPGTGTLAGFGGMRINLLTKGPGNPAVAGAGSWYGITRDPAWSLGTSVGWPQGSGSIVEDIIAGQYVPPGMTANSANPITDIWRGNWTPTSFTGRSVSWATAPGYGEIPLAILIRYGTDPAGHPMYVGKIVPGTYGSTTIPIIPAPASLFALSAILLQRRRRGS
jgi:hypothetical protein